MKKQVESIIADITPLMKGHDWKNKDKYAAWLSQQYYIVRHSTPMLALSCGRSIENREYHLRCIEHLAEEKGHDKMLLNDLKASGCTLQPELPATRAFYSAQYYQVEHVNPVSFLGYILFLEALAIYFGKDIYDAVQTHKGASFLKVHAADDEDHMEKAYHLIEGFSQKDLQDIAVNLEMSAKTYAVMLKDLAAGQAISTRKFKQAA